MIESIFAAEHIEEYIRFTWKEANDYLNLKADGSKIAEHVIFQETARPNDFKKVYYWLLVSLANRQGMPNTIGDIRRLEDVFYSFDHLKTLEVYPTWEKLFNTIKRDVKPSAKMDINNPRSHWVIFCKGSISCAEYLKGFSSLEEFISFVNHFDSLPAARPGLPLLMSYEIFGFGFALACAFLKEIGFSNFSKPDIHLIDILSGLGLSSRNPLEVFRTVTRIAEVVGESPYTVDKVFWLIGSGNLYLHNEKFITDKWEFVEKAVTGWRKIEFNANQ